MSCLIDSKQLLTIWPKFKPLSLKHGTCRYFHASVIFACFIPPIKNASRSAKGKQKKYQREETA